MTLLLREVGGFLAGATAWVGLELAMAAVVATPGALVLQTGRVRSLGAGFLGAVMGASLAVRFGAPLAWAPIIGGRLLPVMWSIAGAVVAVALIATIQRRTPTDP